MTFRRLELMSCFSFKKTKSMSALLEERSKRKNVRGEANTTVLNAKSQTASQSLTSLVDRVKRRSGVTSDDGDIKRRKL